ncbi:MAG: PAS domain-containing protein [bacterium]|nr:PAS domain-containing protein [bacterium]
MDHELYLRRRADLVAGGFDRTARPVLLIDPDSRVAAASDGTGELLGCAAVDLVGRPVDELLRPRELFTSAGRESACTGQPVPVEVRHESGDWIAVEARCDAFDGLPATDDSDEPAEHLLLALFDVSQREHEDELRAVRMAKLSLLNQVSEALYGANLTLDQVLQAVLICITSGEGLRFNRAFMLLVDEQQETLRGELAIGPSNAEEASRIWEDLADGPADLFELMTTHDRSAANADVAVNEIVRNISVPLADADNLLVRSMHERHTLRVSRDLKVAGVEAVAGWLGCDEFAVAPLTTRRGPLGVVLADNAISRTPISALDLEFLQMFANQSASAIENSRLYHELERRLIDLRRAHQKQRENQQTLLRMERLSVMGETSAVVAHELRNPLVSIGGFARTLQRALDEADPNREYARIITEEVSRMETIVNDMLDFVRPQKQLRRMMVIDRLVAETVGRHLARLEEDGIELHYELGCGDLEVSCHPGEIQQVIENFLVNARQVLGPGGMIIVGTRPLAGGVRVVVGDDGPGFAADLADRMFAPFFSTKPTGSGLGLTICDQIIKAHGGVREARNRPVGGAEFAFILPFPRPGETDGS